MAVGLTPAGIDALSNDLKTLAPYLQVHTALPVAGSNEATSTRQAALWADSAGVITATNVAFTGGAASGPALYVAIWSASSGGTCYGWWLLVGDTAFNAAGQYTVTSLVLTGSTS